MLRSETIQKTVSYQPPASRAIASVWSAARKHLIDLIPFLAMIALLAFVIIDNPRG